AGRSAPQSATRSGIRLVLRRGGVGIQCVVNIEVRVYAVSFVQLEDLSKPKIDLVEPVAENSVGIEDINCFIASAAQSAAEGCGEIGAGVDDAGLHSWSGQALEVTAEADILPRHIIGADHLPRGLPACLVMAELSGQVNRCRTIRSTRCE